MKQIIDFFPELLRVNLVASIVILVILAARLVLKRAPKVFSYALWAIVLIRLLVPVSIQSPVSMIPDTPAASGAVINSVLPEIEFETFHDREQNYYESQKPGEVKVYVSQTMEPMAYLSIIWLGGMVCMVLYSGISYLKIRNKTRIAVPLRGNIWIADDIQSPFVIGFIRPRVYLPCNLGEHEQEYIILHEQHHIRRMDHIIKALAFLALTVHWFNPLVWVAFVLACKDMEMSCDEAVIRKLGSDVRADYSASLLALATGQRIIAGTPLAFGEGDTKGRIRNLARWKKPAVWVLVLTVIVCLILGVCLLTDRISRNGEHVGVTYYYGNVTEHGENLMDVHCHDGTVRVFSYEAGNEDIPEDLVGTQVQIRARLQSGTDNLLATQVVQVPDARFDNLDEAIQNAILSHHSHRPDQGILDCASFFSYSSEGRSPAGSGKVDLVTEYGIVYHQGYRLEDGKLVEDGGCNVPTVLTFRVDDDGQYILAEYWEPRDGNLYVEDIKAKFPAFVWPDVTENLFEQKVAVFDQVMAGFDIGPEVVIEYLITDICGREQWASGFADLMTMCEIQREILGYYGTDTLAYCFARFEYGNQNGLDGQVMAYVCNEILESQGLYQIEGWSWQRSGQDWYDFYRSLYPQNDWAITMEAENVTASGLTLVVTQSGGVLPGTLTTGAPYFLQKNENDAWVSVEPLLEAWGWTTEGWIVPVDDTVRWTVNWAWLFGELEPGQYRIGKDIYAEVSPGNYEQTVVYAEFEIS